LNTFRANLCATFRDIAVSDPVGISELLKAVLSIERVHLQSGDVNQKPWPDEFVVHAVIAQHVADILAKETFYAFPKFLNAIYVLLLHSPCAIGCIGRTRRKRFDPFLYLKIPRHVCHQIFDNRESFHRLNRYRSFQWQIAHPRHAHQFRHSVYFS
jgi:hypothetical protein